MLKNKEEIENWLKQYEIENYVINEDLTVDINGNVSLSNKKLNNFPFKFGIIKGSFNCSLNQLESLKNCPKEINGDFCCYRNKIKSLEHCPEKINGHFYCFKNNLTSLKNGPKKIGDNFDCSYNQLISLKYCPKEINGYFTCSDNQLKNLEYSPRKIKSGFACNDNNLKKELLYNFNSVVEEDIYSDFANKENFLNEVMNQKILKEKEELNKIVINSKFSQKNKKRL